MVSRKSPRKQNTIEDKEPDVRSPRKRQKVADTEPGHGGSRQKDKDQANGKSSKSTTRDETARSKAQRAKGSKSADDKAEDKKLEKSGTKETTDKDKKRRKKANPAEEMPLAARSAGLRMYIGAHVSCAKGVQNSVTNAVHIGGNAFAMFLKSQRKWQNPALQDDHRDGFKSLCQQHCFNAQRHVLPHGSYLVNLAQEEEAKAQQAYEAFLDDLQRCDALDIRLYNFHPGSTGSAPRPAAIKRIANQLNRALAVTRDVVPVLEAMAGAGNVIGSTFEDLRDIIADVSQKERIGVCIDTCHIFAAGYDIRDQERLQKVLADFDKIVGMKYLRALHLNDSKAPLASHRDLHQNIGQGFLGLRAFHAVMNEENFEDLPLVLETPIDHKNEDGKEIEDKGVWAREIKLLESLIGMDVESEMFRNLEQDLAAKGAEERAKYQDAFDRKQTKEIKGQRKLAFKKSEV